MRGKINEIGPRRSLRAGARRRLSRAINRAVESHASGYFSVTVGVCTFSIFSLRSSSCARVHSGGDADLRHPGGGRFSHCNPRKFQARRALRKGGFELTECIQGAQVDQIQIGNIGRDLCCNLVQGPLLFPSSQGRAATVDLVGTQGRLDNLCGIDYR